MICAHVKDPERLRVYMLEGCKGELCGVLRGVHSQVSLCQCVAEFPTAATLKMNDVHMLCLPVCKYNTHAPAAGCNIK